MPFRSGLPLADARPLPRPGAGVVRPPARSTGPSVPVWSATTVGPVPRRPRRGPRPRHPPPARAGALRSPHPPPPRRGRAGLRAGRPGQPARLRRRHPQGRALPGGDGQRGHPLGHGPAAPGGGRPVDRGPRRPLGPAGDRRPPTAPARAPSRTTVRLDLGTPLVRLNGSAPTDRRRRRRLRRPHHRRRRRPAATPSWPSSAPPCQEATESARRIVAAWQSAPAPRAPPAPPARAAPRRSSVERTFSLDTLPVRPRPLPAPPARRVGRRLRPLPRRPPHHPPRAHGRRRPRRSSRDGPSSGSPRSGPCAGWWWRPPTTTTVTAVEDGPDRVKVTIEGYSSGVVLLADAYPAPARDRPTRPSPASAPRRSPPASSTTTGGCSTARSSRACAEVTAFADDGIRGVLRPLPTPGALLDSAGQLIGHWMQVGVESDRTVFPVSVDAIRLYGPQPPGRPPRGLHRPHHRAHRHRDAGRRHPAHARRPACGASIDGWTTRRFATDERHLEGEVRARGRWGGRVPAGRVVPGP